MTVMAMMIMGMAMMILGMAMMILGMAMMILGMATTKILKRLTIPLLFFWIRNGNQTSISYGHTARVSTARTRNSL